LLPVGDLPKCRFALTIPERRALQPIIDAAVFALRPDFQALSMTVDTEGVVSPRAAEIAARTLREGCLAAAGGGPDWATAHLEAWREAFRGFGAKPQRTACSADALRARALRDGTLPSLGVVVDLYNGLSLKYAAPLGGEDADAYAGTPRLIRARGDEAFDTMKDGAAATEAPELGEVVWRDDIGVTCRRWNWRQGVRTRLGPGARRMWFIIEGLGAMPPAALTAAGEELAGLMGEVFPGARIETMRLGAAR
jgi:DNA/RNA-binding domain of Phe-tRNA-synthetase-like protein